MNETVLLGIAFSTILGLIAALWRDLTRKIDRISDADEKASADRAAIGVKVTRLEQDYGLLHQFKNSILPDLFSENNADLKSFIERELGHMNRRLTAIEDKLK